MASTFAPEVRWEQLRPGTWWGSIGGDCVGTISEFGWRFRARDADDAWLGDYPALETAQAVCVASRTHGSGAGGTADASELFAESR